MINIENAYKEFDAYVSNFNPEDDKIKLKIEHTKRVAELSRKVAESLNLSKEKVNLAELIGLFHDMGRFKQIQIYNTFNDRISFNHAELSIQLLFDENLIDKFNVDEEYKNIIKLAILNHNKRSIDESLNEEEMLFAKIIRDADKLDIFYTLCEYDYKTIFTHSNFDCGPISDQIMSDFINEHFVNYSLIKSASDQIPTFYAYVFNLYFEFSLKFLVQKNYLATFTNRVYEHFTNNTVKEQVKQIVDITNNFLEKYNK